MKNLFVTITMIGLTVFNSSCKKDAEAETEETKEVPYECNLTTMVDGYETVTIGSQVWMAKNMNIPVGVQITDDAAWINANHPDSAEAWCYYDNDPANGEVYGALYTFSAALKVCPSGWHLPTKSEILDFFTLFGTEVPSSTAGGFLKERGTSHWSSPNEGATDEFCFRALPGGNRSDLITGNYEGLGISGTWWTGTPVGGRFTRQSYFYLMNNLTTQLNLDRVVNTQAHACRCIKD